MIVFGQPGFAIDWHWSTELTAWSGDHDTLRVRVATHSLPRVPESEQEAAVLARRWWRQEGQAALSGAERDGDAEA